MQAYVTGDDIYAQILLLRTIESKAYLLLEGPTDCALVDPHLNDRDFTSIAGGGKSSVVRAMEIVDAQRTVNVAAVVDRDLEEFINPKPLPPDTFLTDLYDMEAVAILDGGVFSRVLSATCDRDNVQSFESTTGTSVRESMVTNAFTVSYVRYVSIRDQLGLRLRDFPLHDVLNSNGLLDDSSFASICSARSNGSSLTAADVQAVMAGRSLPPEVGIEQLCCGHDLVAALSAVGRRFLRMTGSSDQLHRVVRAALDCATFLTTALSSQLDAWARARALQVWTCRTTTSSSVDENATRDG